MSPLNPKSVLIVDDEPDIRVSLKLLLGMFGFRVALAANGQEALDYLHTHPAPCLIVLDLRMPGMSGVQFLSLARRDPSLARIPVVVSSAEDDTGELEAGDDGIAFCPKASDPMNLVRMIHTHCE